MASIEKKPVSRDRFNYRLSKKDFEKACLESSLDLKSRKMLYKIIVEGESGLSVAEEFGITKQALYKSAKKLKTTYLAINGLPENWKQSNLFFSPELLKKIQILQKNEFKNLINEKVEICQQ